jgi:hypothetical protein
MRLHLSGHTTQGVVREAHPTGRDASAPFPCFSVEAEIAPGMSGGPISPEQRPTLGTYVQRIQTRTGSASPWTGCLRLANPRHLG